MRNFSPKHVLQAGRDLLKRRHARRDTYEEAYQTARQLWMDISFNRAGTPTFDLPNDVAFYSLVKEKHDIAVPQGATVFYPPLGANYSPISVSTFCSASPITVSPAAIQLLNTVFNRMPDEKISHAWKHYGELQYYTGFDTLYANPRREFRSLQQDGQPHLAFTALAEERELAAKILERVVDRLAEERNRHHPRTGKGRE